MKNVLSALFIICLLWSGTAQAAVVNKIVAVVNGKMITQYDLQALIAPELAKRNLDPKTPAGKTASTQLMRQALDMRILDILVEEEAKRQKITVSDGEIEVEITQIMQRGKLSKTDFERQLQREGLTPDGLRDQIRRNILRQKLMGLMVGRKVVVSNKEVEDYYNAHKDELVADKNIRMALLVYPKNADAENWARKIKAGSARFEQVARQLSIGPNRSEGGEVNPVPWKKMSPEWRQRVAGMSPGDVTDIFVIQGNKAQFKFLGTTGGGTPMTLEEARPEIENILKEPRFKERFQEYTEQLRRKAVIDIRM